MANFVTGILSLTIGVILLANVFITTVKNTNTSYAAVCANGSSGCTGTWSTSEIALWGILTLVGIAGMAYGVMNVFGIV